ncbi:MAG: NAD(P)/FAD-dependent oxidoreductase [Bacteroidales bacterium]|nr:NAD(P)/FAD-dependent oxidoreductase [Bacteroidales bacterium]
MRDVLVIGGGAAGMMAAVAAAEGGARVTLLERNEKTGKKLYITGKGRCNVTNDCGTDDFLREVARNPRFLYASLAAFSPADMMAFLEENGCPVTVQRGRRVFPASEKASDVTRTLCRVMDRLGVRVCLGTRVRSLLIRGGRCAGAVTADGRTLEADAVIVATGGLSAPLTGSDGDGYRFAEAAGHSLTPRMPSLSAVETADAWPRALQGLALKNVALTLRETRRGKVLYTGLGEMLFTHFGVSGPLVLEMSCHLPADWEKGGVALSLDLKPGLTPEQTDARLQREFAAAPRKQLVSALRTLLPARLADLFPALCGIEAGDKPCAAVTREERLRVAARLKDLPVAMLRLRPIDEAIVTRGGVQVKEIDPATMASKILPGLYFAGEVIDVDAHTGGYNLQIAFSTGRLAGASAAAGE